MSIVEYEAANITPPLKNTLAMKCIAVLSVSNTTQTQDLTLLFSQLTNGHFLTLQADGTKVYIAFATAAGTIDEVATGVGVTTCYPIPDGGSLSFRPMGGSERGSGIATLVNYNTLHYKGATGAATGYLRVYRSSVGPGQNSDQFPAIRP